MKVLTVEGRASPNLTAKACQHGHDILKLDSGSSSKTSPAPDLFVHSQALPLDLDLIGIYPFLDFRPTERTCFS
jgi:hypothetical protein